MKDNKTIVSTQTPAPVPRQPSTPVIIVAKLTDSQYEQIIEILTKTSPANYLQ